MPASRSRTGDVLVSLWHNQREYLCDLVPSRRNRGIRLRVLPHRLPGFWIGPGRGRTRSGSPPPSPTLPGILPNSDFKIRVSFPPRVPRREVFEVVRQYLGWVENQARRLRERQATLAGRALVSGTRLPYRGRWLTLLIVPSRLRRVRWRQDGTRLICYSAVAGQAYMAGALEAWYREQTLARLRQRLSSLCTGMERPPLRLVIRNQKSRWGSCSENGTLSFNWKLAMVPDFVFDYVLVHELSHLREMNHSERFWELVRNGCPRAADAQDWLRRHGPELE